MKKSAVEEQKFKEFIDEMKENGIANNINVCGEVAIKRLQTAIEDYCNMYGITCLYAFSFGLDESEKLLPTKVGAILNDNENSWKVFSALGLNIIRRALETLRQNNKQEDLEEVFSVLKNFVD